MASLCRAGVVTSLRVIAATAAAARLDRRSAHRRPRVRRCWRSRTGRSSRGSRSARRSPRAATSSSTPSQTGYQEVCTDPSYAGQVVVMTYPLIGNYGRLVDDDQSVRPWLRGARRGQRDGRRPRRCPPARGAAARRRHPGHRRRRHPGAGPPPARERQPARHRHRARASSTATTAVERARAVPRWEDQDFVGQVSPPSIMDVGEPTDGGPLVAIVDYGLKANIVRGDAPARRPGPGPAAHDLAAPSPCRRDIDGVILSPGPGRSRPARRARRAGPGGHRRRAAAPRDLPRPPDRGSGGRRRRPRRLRFGHHGANHPVQDVDLGLVQVTAQNHEVQVVGDSLPATAASTSAR